MNNNHVTYMYMYLFSVVFIIFSQNPTYRQGWGYFSDCDDNGVIGLFSTYKMMPLAPFEGGGIKRGAYEGYLKKIGGGGLNN